jgi:xanthine dehydrogenase YagS FAD-binding subunit
VLGWSEQCIATNPSDFCVPLAALDAIVEIAGKAGLREVPLEGFHRLPGDSPERDSVLEPGELVVAVRLPAEALAFSAHSRYLKVRERTSYASRSRQRPPHCGSRAARSSRRESRLAASRQNPGALARRRRSLLARVRRQPPSAAPPLADAKPSGDNAFKIELARRIVTRVLTLAAAGTPARMPALPASAFAPPPGTLLHV